MALECLLCTILYLFINWSYLDLLQLFWTIWILDYLDHSNTRQIHYSDLQTLKAKKQNFKIKKKTVRRCSPGKLASKSCDSMRMSSNCSNLVLGWYNLILCFGGKDAPDTEAPFPNGADGFTDVSFSRKSSSRSFSSLKRKNICFYSGDLGW